MTSFLIDITRFVSRIGHGHPTGIDRVEIEYIKYLNSRDPNCLALAKMGKEYSVIPCAKVVSSLDQALSTYPLTKPRLRDAIRLKLSKHQRAARSYYRAAALHTGPDVGKVLSQCALGGAEHVNVGHSNLSDTVFTAARAAGCSKTSVMVHDMIPLDFPQYTRDGISQQFEQRMKAVAAYANRIICNSAFTESRVERYFSSWNSDAKTVVAHLGVDPFSDATHQPAINPHFAILGTIEPRKNHRLLFDVWDKMAAQLPAEQIPHLHVVGKRGWKNDQVFDYLDSSALMGRHIFEKPNLNDKELAHCISTSRGLLFPSHTEGFGLPALEAAQMSVPVLCSDIPVFHEILGGYATYLDPSQPTDWMNSILNVAKMSPKADTQGGLVNNTLKIPRWASHFRHVFGDTEARHNFDE